MGALELLNRLIKTFKGNGSSTIFATKLRRIKIPSGIIEKLGEEESVVRKAGAWVSEKFSRAKIRLSDSEEGQMGLFHALEGLVLGISGKRGLWSALAAAADTVPQLRVIEYGLLIKRAADQCDCVEAKRLEIARNFLRTRAPKKSSSKVSAVLARVDSEAPSSSSRSREPANPLAS